MPESRLQLNVRLLPVLMLLCLVLQLAFPYRGWLILLVGLGVAWLIGYLWVRALTRGLHLTREMRFGWAQVGDRLQERFTLVNHSHLPALWVELVDHSTLPDYEVSQVTGVDPNFSSQWRTDGICTRRGLYTLGPTSLKTGDPLGIYTATLHYPESSVLMVTPPVVPLPSMEVTPGGRAGEGRRTRADPFERTIGAAGVRDYCPGDDPRWIHWRTSARRGELFVRVFDSTPSSDWWVLLDLDRRVQAGQGRDSTEEHGIILAASLVDRGLRSGRAVGLVAHGEELVWFPPQGGDIQRMAILRALAMVTPGSLTLFDLLERTRPALRRKTSLVIITPAANWLENRWIESLLFLMRRGIAPTVLLLDPVSFRRHSSSPSHQPESHTQTSGAWDEGQADDSFEKSLADATKRTLALLSNLGVARYVITPDLLDRAEARPGRWGKWEWRVSATGRASLVGQPRDMTWKRLQS